MVKRVVRLRRPPGWRRLCLLVAQMLPQVVSVAWTLFHAGGAR